MPFLIRPPLESTAATQDLVFTLFESDHNDRSMLRQLRDWGWRISRHEYHDEEFIEALTEEEKEVKERRRHSHAAGDEGNYAEKPSLVDIWMEEAERALIEEEYEQEKQTRADARAAKEAAGVEAEKYVSAFSYPHHANKDRCEAREYLRSIDRTLKTNNYLDYVDIGQERPRLLTQGLNHDYADATHAPARAYYFGEDRQQSTHIYTTNPRRRSSSVCSFMKKPVAIRSRRTELFNDPRSIHVVTDIHLEPINDMPQDKANIRNSVASTVLMPRPRNPAPAPKASPSVYIPRYLPVSTMHPTIIASPLRPCFDDDLTLIFPDSSMPQSEYIKQAQIGIPRATTDPTSKPLHCAGLPAKDPYGWRSAFVDQQRRAKAGKGSVKFFVGREKRSLNERAMERLGLDRAGANGSGRLEDVTERKKEEMRLAERKEGMRLAKKMKARSSAKLIKRNKDVVSEEEGSVVSSREEARMDGEGKVNEKKKKKNKKEKRQSARLPAKEPWDSGGEFGHALAILY